MFLLFSRIKGVKKASKRPLVKEAGEPIIRKGQAKKKRYENYYIYGLRYFLSTICCVSFKVGVV
ncbi:MAG: hypothetical protein A3G08_03150 [Candidatus Magasanikbacteria bacterium RIFCSPLOWO2_12_FULL_47_9b]|nr:MAG: hypothetical protein A3G08_03150 [Candidatus Magasanikbacteria bacterium RIFCSPLOWO2_12_FULL_47_9b]